MPRIKNRRIFLTAIAVAVVVGCGITPFLFFRQSSSPEPLNLATSQPVSPSATIVATAPSQPSHDVTVFDVSNLPQFADREYRRITIDFDNLSLADALTEFNNKIIFEAPGRIPATRLQSAPATHPVYLHVHDGPLLRGVFELVNQGARLARIDDQTILLTNDRTNNAGTGKTCVAGPFATVLESAKRTKPRTSKISPPVNDINLQFWICAEPSIKNEVFVRSSPSFDEILDDKQQKGAGTSAYYDSVSALQHGLFGCPLYAILKFPTEPGTRLVNLRGNTTVTFIRRTVRVFSESVADGKLQTFHAGNLSVVVEADKPDPAIERPIIRSDPEKYFYLRYDRGDVDPATWKKLVDVFTCVRPTFFSSDGQKQSPYSGTLADRNHTADSVRVEYFIGGSVRKFIPDHVQFDVPIEIEDVNVPFEFKDIAIEP